jgi:charged multivesicular body protein 2B
MNEHLSPQQVGQIMQDFSKESAKMDMSEEMSEFFRNFAEIFDEKPHFLPVNDTLDDILTESGDEGEEADIVNRILDEIGIEIGGQVRHYGAAESLPFPYLTSVFLF